MARRYLGDVRRLLPFLILLALLAAPFGRQAAQAAVHDTTPSAMAGHCEPAAPSTPAPAHHGSIDCMIACAGVAVPGADLPAPLTPAFAELIAAPIAALHGILPQFDPPPPRRHS